jgi:PTH1 family peptidyl-tRNA hydrolase
MRSFFMDTAMKLIVGLGNPGAKYAHTRHNVGFMAIDRLAQDYGFSDFATKHHGLVAQGKIGTQSVLLLKPQTFMNLSGQAVQPLMAFYKITPQDIWVWHDELELPVGRVRVKTGGGHGGHNGLKDIDARIGQQYHRVRIGIGHPGVKSMVSSYVLSDFSQADSFIQDKVLDALSDKAEALLTGDTDKAMNYVASTLQALQPKPEKTKSDTSNETHTLKN